jgi:hypothetical protein
MYFAFIPKARALQDVRFLVEDVDIVAPARKL